VAATGDGGAFGRLFAASLAYVPAVWVIAGLTVALFGVLPRAAAGLAWGVVAYVLVVTLFAEGLDWPAWVDDLSPLSWTPLVPIQAWTTAAALGLGAVAVGLLAVGFGAFRRRDLTTA
jgi:ABC-2 type transport system permease protein